MTIGKKLIGSYAIVLALLALVTLIAINALHQTQTAYDTFLDVDARQVNYADDLRFELRDQIAHYRAMLLYPDLRNQYRDKLQSDFHSFKEALDKLHEISQTSTGEAMLSEIASLQAKHEQAQRQVIDLVQRGKHAEALAAGIKEVSPLTDVLLDKMDQFLERQVKQETEGRANLAEKLNSMWSRCWSLRFWHSRPE